MSVETRALAAPRTSSRGLSADAAIMIVLLAILAAAPAVLAAYDGGFWLGILTRVMINALAAASLALLVAQGGLISLGHAAYFGIGGYAVGIAASNGIDNGFVHLALAVGTSMLFAALSGLVVLRTRGVHFIMVTLAFGQMIYFVMIGLKDYGGDDGLTIDARSAFPGLDLEKATTFYYVAFAALCLATLGLARMRRSRFGLVLAAANASERRVQAAGFDPVRYRLVALVIAGAICGVAGFLNANFANFVTPDTMSWVRSAEFLFMIILGGTGAMAGPLVGAALFIILEQVLGGLTDYWQFPFGLMLIAVVLFGRGGVIGLLLPGRGR